jgi:8-oxo-dGTP pyrophosphatase MutT (NUDIX family)
MGEVEKTAQVSAIDVPQHDFKPSGTERRPAAILVLVRLLEGEPNVLFIRRSQKVRNHKGQISFPGGSFDPEDVTLDITALREAQEELGINPADLKILGALPAADTVVSNFMVHPFVAIPHNPVQVLNFIPDGYEVGEIFHVPLPELLQPRAFTLETWRVNGHSRQMVFYTYHHYVIWGATAFILHNFLGEIKQGHWQELFELDKLV